MASAMNSKRKPVPPAAQAAVPSENKKTAVKDAAPEKEAKEAKASKPAAKGTEKLSGKNAVKAAGEKKKTPKAAKKPVNPATAWPFPLGPRPQ